MGVLGRFSIQYAVIFQEAAVIDAEAHIPRVTSSSCRDAGARLH